MVVPARRASRTRLSAGGCAAAALAAADGLALAQGGRFAGLAAAAAVVGIALLTAALALRLHPLLPWALAATGTAYLAGRAGHHAVDGRAAVVGALLLLAAELGSWSIEDDARIRAERALVVRRLVAVGALVAAALAVDVVLLAAAAVASPAGVVLAAAGVAAAVTALALVLRLVRHG